MVDAAYDRGRSVWMLLDAAPCHMAHKSQSLAASLDIQFVWLPKQCPELNAMDQLWKELKSNVSANHQFATIEEHAACAEDWLIPVKSIVDICGELISSTFESLRFTFESLRLGQLFVLPSLPSPIKATVSAMILTGVGDVPG